MDTDEDGKNDHPVLSVSIGDIGGHSLLLRMNEVAATSIDVIAILRERGGQVDAALRAMLDAHRAAPAELIKAIEYSLLAGGKRLRPVFVLEWFSAISGQTQPNKSALAAAVAIELIHTFSLVHDDLPAMDDDDLRRGVPTNHKVFGEAMAILAGDAMTAMAFETIATDTEPKHVAPMIRALGNATGPAGMIGGQVLDIAGENISLDLAQLQEVHALKTGALLTCACRLGAIAANASADQLAAAETYGKHVGLAFQIMDDVLDETATAEQMGKATGKDSDAGKNTYPRMLGLEQSVKRAKEELAAATSALDPKHTRLAALADFIVSRRS